MLPHSPANDKLLERKPASTGNLNSTINRIQLTYTENSTPEQKKSTVVKVLVEPAPR